MIKIFMTLKNSAFIFLIFVLIFLILATFIIQ